MEKKVFLQNLEDIIEAEPGSVTENTSLDQLAGWDSMAIMGFIAFADEELGGAPAPKSIKECKSVADLMVLTGV